MGRMHGHLRWLLRLTDDGIVPDPDKRLTPPVLWSNLIASLLTYGVRCTTRYIVYYVLHT